MQAAVIAFWGVLVGAVVSLLGSVLVPWLREALGERRQERRQRSADRQRWLLATLASLLDYRMANLVGVDAPDAQAKFGAALNELTVRLSPEEQSVVDVIYAMFAMAQKPRKGVDNALGESMFVLSQWVRGDFEIQQLIPEVERRAGVKFSVDRRSVSLPDQPT